MTIKTKQTDAAAVALTEYSTILDSYSDTRKRASTPSRHPSDLEKQPLLQDRQEEDAHVNNKPQTFLYLAYGSNLAKSTFEGVRGVKPLQVVNVHVPELELTFDLPGIAYTEPCFANTRLRKSRVPVSNSPDELNTATNLGWKKGLVGVVYEVTAADYKHIIETEGGGAGYADVQVPCYILPKGSQVTPEPDSYPEHESPEPRTPEKVDSRKPFLVHTLLASPPTDGSPLSRTPGWAQPSPRYLGLLKAGAAEHVMPKDYQQWLHSLQPYRAITWRQKVGGTVFQTLWLPVVLALRAFGSLLSDERGVLPRWFQMGFNFFFNLAWRSYDVVFYPLAGDGERTEGT